jgi:hypothetical protein
MSWPLTYSGGNGSNTDRKSMKPEKIKTLKVVDDKSTKKEQETATTGR